MKMIKVVAATTLTLFLGSSALAGERTHHNGTKPMATTIVKNKMMMAKKAGSESVSVKFSKRFPEGVTRSILEIAMRKPYQGINPKATKKSSTSSKDVWDVRGKHTGGEMVRFSVTINY